MVVCSNLTENEIDLFIFANIRGGLIMKGWENLKGNGQPREIIINIKRPLFIFFLLTIFRDHIKGENKVIRRVFEV